jgi:hypothetical protein
LETFFHKPAALQYEKPLRMQFNNICSGHRNKGGPIMQVTKSLNVLMFCAAFAFVGAIVMGLIQ